MGIVDIMIARHDKDLDTSLCEPIKPLREIAIASQLTIFRQISTDEKEIRTYLQSLLY